MITHELGDGWWPDRFVRPALGLAGAVVLVVGLSVLGSALFTGTANGIAIFMLFGAGLVAGLLGQIGEALGSETLEQVATVSSWVLPFEALYQDALHQISAESFGLTRVALQLGPFGGAEAGGAPCGSTPPPTSAPCSGWRSSRSPDATSSRRPALSSRGWRPIERCSRDGASA